MTPISATFELFDDQAAIFDQRTGLPVEACRAVALAVVEAGKVGPGDMILEIGPGTGQIGRWFNPPLRYIGLDKSAAMLEQFRNREESTASGRLLIRADANQVWPVASGVARVIFSSRAMHLLDQEHAASEVFRVASPDGAALVLGRVQRLPESVRARMAREMNLRLRSYGFEGRGGEQRNRELIEACRRRGAQALEPRTVASWKVAASGRESIEAWRCLRGLGGVLVPPETKEEILDGLAGWAESEFNGLDRQFESEEAYVIRPVWLPPAGSKP
ncbi:MAG TPA: methyltransferase domain-containing protein [Blastocatellia bacterium]|nr:methyltransferase domain-containing protein [Blastocatellia bacterium]